VGHPDYYQKFGFKNAPGLVHGGVPPEVFFALSFDGHTPQGAVAFHEGFKAEGQSEGENHQRADLAGKLVSDNADAIVQFEAVGLVRPPRRRKLIARGWSPTLRLGASARNLLPLP
jgi:hypothetical protein